MFKKVALIILIILCLGMLVSTVAASEVNETFENQKDSVGDVLSLNETSIRDDADFTTLAKDINNGGESVKLTRNYTMKEGETHVVISKSNILIDGQGHTLDADNRGNIFGVSGTNIIFKNITFINGLGVNGGAIGDFYGSGKNYTVIDCTFINNTATNCGGALYAQYSPIYVYNSTFKNNRNYGNYGGGAIFSDRNIYVDGCNFYGNTISKSSGSAIRSSEGSISLSNSIFLDSQLGFNSIQASSYDVSNSYSSFTDLNRLIDNSNGAINLQYDYRYMPGYDNGGIIISKSITVNGDGHNIDADGNALCVFTVTGNDVVLKNLKLVNAYIKEINNIGVAVSWRGENGVLDNVVIRNSTFDSVRNAGRYNWWNSGIIYWDGSNGRVNNVSFISDKVVSSNGIVIWMGANGVINNSYFNDCMNAFNSYVGYSQANSFFIYWNADNGKFLNSHVENLKLGVRNVPKPCYVSFIKPGHVVNVTFSNCQHSNSGQTVYDLNMPFSPIEDYVINFTGSFLKQNPTINISDVVVGSNLLTVYVNTVRSGSLTYRIDGGKTNTVTVDANGQVQIDVSGLSDGEHEISYSYSGNDYYNAVSTQTDNFFYTSFFNQLLFSEVKIANGLYNYAFSLQLKDGNGNPVGDMPVTYKVLLANGSLMTLHGMGNVISNFSGQVPLLNLTALFNGLEIAPDYYPINALQMLIDNADGGDTINLVHDYVMQSDEDPITISKKITLDGQGHTVDANGHSLFSVTGNNVILRNMNLINGYLKDVNNNGVIISWIGGYGVLDNVVIKNSTFDSSRNAGRYNWWNSGIIYWKGSNGMINNLKLLCSTVVSSKGCIIWEGANGVINNSYFADCSNAYNGFVGYSQAISFFIYWNADNGKFLNTRVEGLKLSTRSVDDPYYVSFTKLGYVDNVTFINCQNSNAGQTVYDLNMPFDPVENYVKNFNGTVVKKTPSITLNNNVFTVNPARSGVISYSVNAGEVKTSLVDENGHFTIDYDFNSQKNYLIKITYNENMFYNSVVKFFDYNNGQTDAFGSFTDLNNLILSSSASIINLNKNYIYDPIKDSALSGGIIISKSITINGNGYYIDADYNPVRIFTVNDNVVLNNIVFKNSRLDSPGNAVLANSPVDINNCTFDNNWALNSYGAALNLAGGNSNVNFCSFTNNNARAGAAIIISSNNNHIQYSYFRSNFGDYGGVISSTGSCTSHVNYNIFLDDKPLSLIDSVYSRNNWYGSNSLPDSGNGNPPNYLKASLDYTLNNNVLTVGIVFSESDTGNIVNVPWKRAVSYTVSSSTIIGDNLKKVSFSGITSPFTLNAVIDNQRLTVNGGNSWYVNTAVSSSGLGTQTSPFKTLLSAINNAKNGDVIYIAPGTYIGNGNVKLIINKELTLERWGDEGEVIFDGQNTNYIFTLNSNAVISSLTFKNAKNSNGGALNIKSNTLIVDCTFRDNQATGEGGAIYLSSGKSTIINSHFTNNYAPSAGGAISMAASNLNVISSVFITNSGQRGGAINSGNAEESLYVADSTFINNSAKSYGGAVTFDGTGNITDSVFINNTAVLGGGAVYMWDYSHFISNSRFINNSAADGGAIIFILSDVSMNNNYFENNNAFEFGGGIFAFGNLAVIEGSFAKNRAYYDGGAVYIYKGVNSIYETFFKGNLAGYGGGGVHALAADMFCVRLNMMANSSAELNGYVNTVYLNSFIDFGNYTLVVADTSNYDGTLPSRFSLVENGWDTPVKNQGSMGICWDYAVVASVETAIKKATGIEYDLSENNVKNLISRYSIYGNGRNTNAGGTQWDALSYFANSLGPVLEIYDKTGTFEFSPLLGNVVHVSNIAFATRNRNDPLANDEVKEAVIKYGGVRASMHVSDAKNGYNFYENSITGTNHAILIVGWDDNYAASNFPHNCPGNGAWIVKNSWGPNSGKNGYIYISYYDVSFAWSGLTYIIFNDTVRYDRVYQYDYSGYDMRSSGGTESWYKNTYTSVKNEALTAFSTYFNTKSDWEVSVYVGDELKHTQSGSSISQGYFTFNFDKVIPVAKGEEFTIVVKVNNNNFPFVSKTLNTLPCGEGVSYYSKDGVTWTDLNNDNQVASLKVFTQNLPGSIVTINPIVNVTYDGDVTVEFGVENRTEVTCIVKTVPGKVVMSLDDVKGNSIKLSGLGAGNYTVTIINSNSDNYIGDEKSSNFTVFKAHSLVNINPIKSITYPDTVGVTYTIVNSTAVTYIVKTKNGAVAVSNTTLTNNDKITLPLLDAGEYIITVANAENENYTGSAASLSFTVFKKTPVINVEVVNVVYPGNVVVSISSDVAGTYTVKVGNKSQNVVLNAGEVKNVDFSGLDADNYAVTLSYEETVNYNNVSKKTSVKVLKASSHVTINTIIDATYPGNVNVIFTVVNKTSLVVKITDKNSRKSFIIPEANITDNNAVIGGLNAGDYSVTINNTGDKNYNSSYSEKDFKVNKYTPKISVHTSDIIYSDALIIRIISDVSGIYTLKVGGVTQKADIVSDTSKNISFKGLKAGKYNVSVIYNESMNYNGVSTDNISVKVIKASSSVNITNASNGVYKTKSPTVAVKFENGTSLNYTLTKDNLVIKQGNYNDLASALENLDVGKYALTITNKGDENHNQSSDSAIFEVLKANSKIIISDIESVVYNTVQNISLEVYNRTVVTYLIRNNNGRVVVQNTTLTDNTVSLRGLSCGQYTLVVANSENENYNGDVKSLHFTIDKAVNDIEIIISNKVLPGNVTVRVKASVDGLYAVNIGKYSVNVHVQSGEGTAEIAIPSGFNYAATASFEDSENYTLKVKKAIFNVTKGINNIKIEVNDVNYPDNVSIKLSADIKGTYAININGTVIDIAVNENNGSATGTVHLTPGSYRADIINYCSEDYEAKTISSNFNVNNGFNTVKVQVKDIKYDESAEIHLTASVRGNYTVSINGTEIIIEVPENGATAIKNTDRFTKVGKYYVNVTSKLPYYTQSITNATFNVLKAFNNIKVEVADVRYPGNVSVRVLADVDGEYNVLLDNGDELVVSVVDGYGFKSVKLDAGNYSAGVSYSDVNYEGNVTNDSFKVLKGVNRVIVDVDDVKYGESAWINVSAGVDGVYTVKLNGSEVKVDVVNGVGSNKTDILTSVGKYSVQAVLDDDNYDTLSNNATFNVLKAVNKIIIEANGVVYPDNVKIRLTADVDGIYTLKLNDNSYYVQIINKTGFLNVNLAAGNYSATVEYSSDCYDAEIKNTSFEVLKGKIDLKLVINKESFVFNHENITGYVTSSLPGNYSLTIGNIYSKIISISNAYEIIEFNAGKLDAGDYTVFVNFDGNENYTSKNDAKSFKVSQSETVLTVTANDYENVYATEFGVKINIKNHLPDDATGHVEYAYENGEYITCTGVGESFILDGLNASTYKINARYSGDKNYDASESSITLIVKKAINNVKLEVIPASYPENITVKMTADIPGNYTLMINDKEFNMHVLANKTEVKSLSLTPGSYTASIHYDDMNYEANASGVKFEIANGTVETLMVVVDNVNYSNYAYAEVYASVDGNYTIYVNSKIYNVTVMDGFGVSGNFELLNAGKYEVKVKSNIRYYDVISNSTSFNVLRINSSLNIGDIEFVYGTMGGVAFSYDGACNVTVSQLDGAVITVKNNLVTISSLNAGEYKLNVTTCADLNHLNVSKIINVNVIRANPDLTVDVADVKYTNQVLITVNSKVDGIYNVDVNGTNHVIEVRNGIGQLNVSKTCGNYKAFVEISQSANYNASSAYCEFKVSKNDDYDYVTTPDSVINHTQSVMLYASLNEDATGKVTFTDIFAGEIIGTCGINEQFTANFHAGNYLINVSYEGDDNYKSRWNVINLTVKKVSDDNALNITFNNPIYGENIIVRADAGKYDDAEGIVFYYLGDKCIGNSTLKSEGIISNDFDAGRYNITAVYHSMDYDFEGVFELVVGQAASIISSSDAVVNYADQPFTLRVTSQNATNISYSIYDKDKKLIKNDTVDAGENIELPKLNAGEYSIVLSTVTDRNHMSATVEYDIVVANAEIQINIVAQNSTYGLKPLIKINVSVSGEYKIEIGDVYNKTEKLFNGTKILDDLDLDAGNYEITVTSMIPNFDKTVASQRFTIEKANVGLDIKVSDVKEDMNISLMIVANATGMVKIIFNSKEYEVNLSETDTLTLPHHPVGEYFLSATFIGDKNHYQSDTFVKTLKVNSYTASDLQKEIDDAVKNNKKELNLTHDYIFSINETVVINLPITINGNNHMIDANSSSSIFKIASDNVTLTEMTLTNSNGSAILVMGDNFKTSNLSFIRNCADEGGAIQVKAENATIQDCRFINNTANRKGGAIFIRDHDAVIINSAFINNTAKTGAAVYIENSSMSILESHFKNNQFERGIGAVSVGDNVKFDVDENTRLSSDVLFDLKDPCMILDSVRVNGSGVEIKVNLSADVGNVSVMIGNEKFSSEVENKQAVIKLGNLKNGRYSDIPVIYNGPDYYEASKISINFTVQPVQSQVSLKIISNKNVNLCYLENKMFSVNVVDEVGKPASGVSVTFNINGQIFNAKTDGEGLASVKISLKPGTYTVKTSIGNHEVSNKIIIKHIVSTKKVTKVKKSAKRTIIKITVKGHNVKQSSKLKFKYSGKNKVKVRFGKNMKKQIVTVKFKGKTYNVKVNKKGVGTLKLTKKVAKKLKKGKKYKAKVTYSGPKLYKKVKLVVKFKGKKYNVKTNSKGIAKFKVTKKMVKKLKKGKKVKYTITYKKDTVKRFVKIR